jgi:hypothetical protein
MSLREHIQARRDKLRREVDAAKAVIATKGPLLAELEALLSIEDNSTATTFPINGHAMPATLPAPTTIKYTPAIAVRRYLSDKPNGVAIRMLVDDLKDNIDTQSDDPKRILYNTVFNLRKRGTLVAAEIDGREGVRLAGSESSEDSE